MASVCPSKDVCFKLNIPDSTASSGNGDVFFQISAPSSYEWVALGQGTSMASSNMFLVYTSANGNNVTLSPRTASGHVPPNFNSEAQVTLLEGSGVANGIMTANVKCKSTSRCGAPSSTNPCLGSNCNSWSRGTMDFKSSKGNWVYAFNPSNGPKNSDSQSASIREHTEHESFSWDFATAKGGNSVNPLLTAAPVAPGAGSGAGPAGPGGITSTGGGSSNRQAMLIAHGVLASLAFVILFPAGAIAIRLASIPGIAWIHGGFQIFAYMVYIAATGLGINLACGLGLLNSYHPIIGLVVLAVLFFQPIIGVLHHRLFKVHNGRTLWSYGHIWLGRATITLGIINGGLGLRLANNTNSGKIAYGVIAGFMWLAWVAAMVIGEKRRKTAVNQKERAGSDGSEGAVVPPTNGHYEPKQT